MQAHGNARYSIESVDNALRILLLVQRRGQVRVTECAVALDVAPSTAHRLLTTMVRRGFLLQDRGSRGYRPGPALMEIAYANAGVGLLRRTARPVAEALAARVHETVNVAVLEEHGVRFVECVEGDQLVRVSSRTGVLLPAHATAAGKVLLAHLPPGELERRLGRLERLTSETITSRRDLREQLEEVAARGHAINRGESLEGLRAIAVPVRGSSPEPVAALAISVPMERGRVAALRRLLPHLMLAARALGEALPPNG